MHRLQRKGGGKGSLSPQGALICLTLLSVLKHVCVKHSDQEPFTQEGRVPETSSTPVPTLHQ